MPPKKFKPSILTDAKPHKSTSKSRISLTNTEYDEIFNAVINKPGPSQQYLDFKSPLVGKSPQVNAFTPKECASLENSQNANSQKQNDEEPKKEETIQKTTDIKKPGTELVVSSNKPKQTHSESSNNNSESISTIHSEDFRKNAAFSTPVIKEIKSTKKKQKSFREAVKNLKDTESQLNDSLLGGLSQAQTSLNNSLLVDTPLSQPPANLNHRERLLWLQARRGENVFVQCDSCDKWRLSDAQDPVDLPNKWYCYMNKDVNFNQCSIPEQKLSIYVEADIIVNQYTAGSLVWAKIYSYPWWPAMVDDDPDTEQYYWIEDYDLNIPTSYNVTFFDRKNEPVTRAWITAKNLKSFKHNLNLDRKNVPNKYKARLRSAKEEAFEAMKLPIKARLSAYSFISKTDKRINTPIATPIHSTFEDDMDVSHDSVAKKPNKRRCAVSDPLEQLKNAFMQKVKKNLETVKEIDKKQDKMLMIKTQNENKKPKNQPRESVSGKLPERDGSKDLAKPKKVYKRRNTRVDTSVERDRSISQDSAKEKKITKRRKTVSEYEPQTSGKSAIGQNTNKIKSTNENNTQKRRKSIAESFSERDSSQDLAEPKKVSKRRNTRVDSSIERDRSISQDSIKEKKIIKRRKTIGEYESQASSKSAIEQDSNKVQNENKTQKRRKSITESFSERDSSQDLAEPKKVSKRRNTRVDTSIERDRSISQDSIKEKKITKRRQTINEYDSQTSGKSAIDQNTNQLNNSTNDKNQKRRKSISGKLPQRDSSQDLAEPKKVFKHTNTRVDTSIERDRSISQDSTKEKKITKRRQTIGEYDTFKKGTNENKIQKRRQTIAERDSSQDLAEPKKVPRRRNTRVDTSNERDRSLSQESNIKKKITKRRTTIGVSELETSSEVINPDSNNFEDGVEENKIPQRRNSTLERISQRDSSQELGKPKRNYKRRNTCIDTSIERDSSFSQDSTKEKTITKRRKTIGEYEAQTSGNSQNTVIEQNSNTLENANKGNKIQKRKTFIPAERDTKRDSSQNSNISENKSRIIHNTSVERDSSFTEDSKKRNRITKRRTTIGKHDSQYSILERNSQNSDVPEKKSKLDEYGSQTSQKTIKARNSQESQIFKSNTQNDNKENKIKRRRNTIHEKKSQNSDDSQKVAKRRNTLAEFDSQILVGSQKIIQDYNSQQIENNSQNEKKRGEKGSPRDNSQNSDGSRKITKRRNTRLDSSIEKENTTSQSSMKEKKIPKRRKTIGEYNYQTLNVEVSEHTNTPKAQQNKISYRRNTIEKESSFTDLSIRSVGGTILNKRRNKFVCPTQNPNASTTKLDDTSTSRLNESQSEPKKYRKTLGARKIVSTNKVKNIKGAESGYESAISMKKEEKKQNLSIISEESISKLNMSTYTIPKKRRQTTDGQEKKIDEKKKVNDEELEITFTSLSQSLEQLDVEKRKKKFMAICQEIVNVDKDLDDPTISEEEKLFYEKLNSNLKQVKEKRDNLNDDKLMKKVEAFENKLQEVESKEDNIPKTKDNFKLPLKSISNTTSAVTSANTSMYSDISDNENVTTKKISNQTSPTEDQEAKKKPTSLNNKDSLSFQVYDFKEDF